MAAHAFYHYTADRVMRLRSGEGDATVESRSDAWAIEFRDLIRNGDGESYQFNQALPARYKVSDVAKFSNGSRDGYAFVVRDTTAGVEWLFLFSGYDSSGNEPAQIFYLLPGYTSSYDYYQGATTNPDNTGYPTVSGFGISVFYNPDYATSTFDMGFDDTVNLTYSGGDLSAPAGLPATNTTAADAFLPNASVKWPRGIVHIFDTYQVNGSDMMLWFDEDEPSVTFLLTAGGDGDPYACFKLGNFINPDDPGDPYEQGSFWVWSYHDNDDAGDPISGEGFVDSFDPTGNRVFDLDIVVSQTFTKENELTVGGELKWRRVGIQNAGLTKGEFKDDSAREIGAFNDRGRFRQIYAENPAAPTAVFYKVTDAMAVKYPINVPAFPFTFPTKP